MRGRQLQVETDAANSQIRFGGKPVKDTYNLSGKLINVIKVSQ